MTTPEFKDYDKIINEMITELANKGTKITDMNPGSNIRTLLEVAAVKFDEIHYIAEQLLKLYFAATTAGEYLDRKVMEKGLIRFLGSKSIGFITASRSTPAPFSQVIPIGTIFETIDQTVQIETTAEVTLLEGAKSVSIPVISKSVGIAGNLQAGILLKQVGIAVNLIEVTAVDEPGLSGGADKESDDELRQRYLTILRSPGTSGNKADYVKWALEVPGVGGVYPLPLWNGNGTVKLFLLGMDKSPAAAEVVEAAQDYIDPNPALGEGKAPIGATVTCVAAPSVAINVSASINLDGTKTITEVEGYFEYKLTEYLKEIAFLDSTVRYSYIGSLLLTIPGVIDYTNLVINDGTGNVIIPAGAVAVKGMVVLS